jgi:hypothetical protein
MKLPDILTEIVELVPDAGMTADRTGAIDTVIIAIEHLPGFFEPTATVTATQEESPASYEWSSAANTPTPTVEAPLARETVVPEAAEATIVDIDAVRRVQEATQAVDAAHNYLDEAA